MDSSLRIDLDTALGGPKGAEPGPDHGRAAGGFTLPGGQKRAPDGSSNKANIENP